MFNAIQLIIKKGDFFYIKIDIFLQLYTKQYIYIYCEISFVPPFLCKWVCFESMKAPER
jgi:hypothetical protein